MAYLSLWPAGILYFMLFWGLIEYYANRYYSAKYEPARRGPLTRTSKSVSVVVRTLHPPPIFKNCLLNWIANNPLEILIVTTKDHIDSVGALINEVLLETGVLDFEVKAILSGEGARKQLLAGVQKAKGDIIATSDNHILWGPEYLKYMLPAFDDPKVGAAGPQITVNIPKERRNPAKITKWEVAGTRLVDRASNSAMMLVVANWCWILPGTTCMFRAEILQTDEFAEGYLNDYWRGVWLDVGEDTWISRYILKKDYIITIQKCEETNAARTVKRSAAYINQILRWERSTIQSYMRTVTTVPQMRNHWLIIFKTLERLVKSPLLVVHFVAWCFSIFNTPYTTLGLFSYFAYYKYKDVTKFLVKYPYMRKYWWIVIAQDFSGLYFNAMAYWTLCDASWERDEGGRKSD